MFGIMASVIRTATRMDYRPETELERDRRLHDRRGEKRRRAQESLDNEIQFRRGYW